MNMEYECYENDRQTSYSLVNKPGTTNTRSESIVYFARLANTRWLSARRRVAASCSVKLSYPTVSCCSTRWRFHPITSLRASFQLVASWPSRKRWWHFGLFRLLHSSLILGLWMRAKWWRLYRHWYLVTKMSTVRNLGEKELAYRYGLSRCKYQMLLRFRLMFAENILEEGKRF